MLVGERIATGRSSRGFTLVQLMMAIALVGILSVFALPSYTAYVERARVARAIGDLGEIDVAIKSFELRNNGALPANLTAVGFPGATDPWGNPYQYANFSLGDPARTDQFGDPVNQEYDLVSMGEDGATALGLTAAAAQDDIVRGNDGTYLGLVRDYPRLP